jgi:16S rRNA (guanine1516-N2)-methyltransferase
MASKSPLVWDVTAGLGRDAWLLACMGCRVVAIERSPILGVMLHDALSRACEQLGPEPGAQFQVVVTDARRLLQEVPRDEAPDVVYMDPMFGARRRKTALAKKEMRVLGRLIGNDPDAGELFEAATRAARQRVVVKRRSGAPPLVPRPDTEYSGKIARYDVYFTRNVVIPSDLDYGEEDEFELGEAYDDPCATDRTCDSDNDDSLDEPIPF